MHEHRIVYEEVPGSRTTQEAIVNPQRERIAYEELQPGDVIQEGDEWQHECGRWKPFASLDGSCVQVRHTQRARRPYNITRMENDRAEAIAEVAKLSAELWARKPLEDRVASLTEELAQARAGGQQLLKTIADNADQFAEHTASLVQERDEARAKSDRLQGLIDDLLDEPTARQVQDMLRTWATELDWSTGCFDSTGREQIDTIQKTLVAVIERIEGLINPEGGTDDN